MTVDEMIKTLENAKEMYGGDREVIIRKFRFFNDTKTWQCINHGDPLIKETPHVGYLKLIIE